MKFPSTDFMKINAALLYLCMYSDRGTDIF